MTLARMNIWTVTVQNFRLGDDEIELGPFTEKAEAEWFYESLRAALPTYTYDVYLIDRELIMRDDSLYADIRSKRIPPEVRDKLKRLR